ncbi:MAG TPA: hypothetical protein P5205_20635 [Candidatus Paceibacterota bacterium]|nr:hypothetical protein [Verrucomicrobiota bacterium]HSA12772.1 hypothetical protein [Candidatus Paceibacterota bacterium]
MNTKVARKRGSQKGYALIMVLVLAGASILIYSSAANWTSTGTVLNDRNNTYNGATAAAEAATEVVLAYMSRDFFNGSFGPGKLDYYSSFVPTNDWAAAYEFSDGAGTLNATWVTSSANMVMTNLDSQFTGLYGLAYSCGVRGNARPLGTRYDMAAAVEQNFQLACIPIFQFAIFYTLDLEINPGAPMKVTGKVHSNGNLYSGPPSSLEFSQSVDAAGQIYGHRAPYDPTGGGATPPIYHVPPVPYASSLTLPISTNNSPSVVQEITELPPFGEDRNSPMGQARYYNQCDLIITTTATNVTVQTGAWDNFTQVPPDQVATNGNSGYSFIQTTNSFYDGREKKWTQVTDINVGALTNWMQISGSNGGYAINNRKMLGIHKQLNSIYVDDRRANSTKLTAVRVSNGRHLPSDGLTLATRHPLYVQGHFNAPTTTVGSTNTANTKPASLVGDAITVLSGAWSDANSTKALKDRDPVNTTVNAAFLAGIVQPTNTTGVRHYSGGVENFPRFLEDWSSSISFTYNGSMVVMYPSQFATNYWVQTGTYYNAPSRKWAFDANFLDYTRLPPATPMVKKLVRGQWQVVKAH